MEFSYTEEGNFLIVPTAAEEEHLLFKYLSTITEVRDFEFSFSVAENDDLELKFTFPKHLDFQEELLPILNEAPRALLDSEEKEDE